MSNRGRNKVTSQFGVGSFDTPGEAATVSVSEYGSEAQSTLLTGRVVRALESRTSRSTLSMGAGLIRRTPDIVVSKAFLAFPASVCNGWACLWGLAQGREWHRRRTCEPVLTKWPAEPGEAFIRPIASFTAPRKREASGSETSRY